MSIRTNKIINRLLENSDLTINDIACEFGVSNRSIRNDIRDINEILIENKLDQIEVKADKIVKLNRDSLSDCLQIIASRSANDVKYSREERVSIIVEELIGRNDYVNISDLAEKMFVSNSTISGDLKHVSNFIGRYNLSYISEPYVGIKLEGKEIDKRKLLVDVIAERSTSSNFTNYSGITNVPNEDVIDKFSLVISYFENHSDILMTDESYSRINRYLYVMIQRIRQGATIDGEYEASQNPFSQKAKEIGLLIQDTFKIEVSDVEIAMMAEVLSNLKYINYEVLSDNIIKIQFFVNRLIDELRHILKIDLSDDYLFFNKLCVHIDYMTKNKIVHEVGEDIIKQVTAEHENVRQAIVDSIYILEELLDRKISSTEIDYILIHICTAIERKRISESSIKAVIVTDIGIATTQFLIGKIKSNFDFPIVDIIPVHALKTLVQNNVDFIISTVNLEPELVKVPYVTVNYNFGDRDYSKIYHLLSRLRKAKDIDKHNNNALIKDIKNVLKKHNIENDTILSDLLHSLRDNGIEVSDEDLDTDGYKLSDLLTVDNIVLDVESDDWKDSVYKASLPLLNNGYIEKRYIGAMVAHIENDSPYMIIAPGFIVPHGGVNDGGLKPGISLIRHVHPIAYSDKVEINYVSCLSVVDMEKHLKAFFTLVAFVQDKSYFARLNEAKTSEEIYKLVKEFERYN